MSRWHWIVAVLMVVFGLVAVMVYDGICRYRSELSNAIPQGRQIVKAILASAHGSSGSFPYSEGFSPDGYRFEAGYEGDDEAAVQRVVAEVNRTKYALGLNTSYDDDSWYGFVPFTNMRTWHLSMSKSTNKVMVTLTWK